MSTLVQIPPDELQEVGCPYPEPQLGFLVHEPRKVNNLTLIDGKTFLSTTISGDITPPGAPDVGFFHDDTRFLSKMELKVGAPFEFVWRNDELTNPPGNKPEGFGEEHRMQSRITELDPPRKISFTWQNSGDVTFELEPRDDKVLLTVTHRRLPDRRTMLMVGPGWHMHLDVLVARVTGTETGPFWDGWLRLQKEYAQRLAA